MDLIKKLFLIILGAMSLLACSSPSSEDSPSSSNSDDFDREALLINLADNIIIPAYEDLNIKLKALKLAKDDFISQPDNTNLVALRASWLGAYRTWQFAEMFNIGKAEEILFAFQMNIYPVSITDVEANVFSGTYDLSHTNNNDAVGFPAVDYMLFGIANDDVEILNKYADVKYLNYLSDLINQMQSLTETVLNDWKTSYRDTFVSQKTNTVTSTLNKFVNDYIFYYEKGLRANKFGIPAGVFSSTPLPDKVEGLYSKNISKELALDALLAVQNTFNGKYYGSDRSGESFKSYLGYLKRNDLATAVNSRFDAARQKIQVLDMNFNSQINTDNTKMTEAFDALQLIVVSLKVDMLQAFNISVDYVDADGD